MTAIPAANGYVRGSTVVWRDTGDHVVALPLGARTEVMVLGGGSAQLWRLLHRPRTLSDLVKTFADGEARQASRDDVASALQGLVDSGLVRVLAS